MAYQANILRVMIASPGDVQEERRIVTEEIYRWNDANSIARNLVLQPIKWETHSSPQLGAHPQSIINDQLLQDADIVVAIFGTRIGTATEENISGTVEEIKRHVASRKTAMLYFSDVPVSPSAINPEQYAALQKFRSECQTTGLYATFDDREKFRLNFSHHLDIELNKAQYRWLTTPPIAGPPSSKALKPEALRLLRAAVLNKGALMHRDVVGGEELFAGTERFMNRDGRSIALWRGILKELVGSNLIEKKSASLYNVTAGGYAAVDEANANDERSPFAVHIAIGGTPERQLLVVETAKTIRLQRLEFLLSTDASIATQPMSDEGSKIDSPIMNDCIISLFNTPRPDRLAHDHSGPAKLRLTFLFKENPYQVILPIMLQPVFVGSTQWIRLIGSEDFQVLPVSNN
jgi:Domain of unknown function (DUF4062)